MMKKIILSFIVVYQKIFSPSTGWLGASGMMRPFVCMFYPTCSEYCKDAVTKFGALRGVFLCVKRIGRCHPWQKPRIDLP